MCTAGGFPVRARRTVSRPAYDEAVIWFGLIVAVLVTLFVLDRLMLAAERRGWIYYRRRKPTSGSASAAALGPVMDVFRPQERIVVEERLRQQTTRRTAPDGAGRPPG
jgi:hypothetical protein